MKKGDSWISDGEDLTPHAPSSKASNISSHGEFPTSNVALVTVLAERAEENGHTPGEIAHALKKSLQEEFKFGKIQVFVAEGGGAVACTHSPHGSVAFTLNGKRFFVLVE